MSTGDIKHTIQSLLGQGRFGEALPLLESVCQRMPDNLEARYLLGSCQAKLGDLDAAVVNLRHCADRQSSAAPVQFALAGVLLAKGDTQDAKERLRQAIACKPAYLEARLALADLLVREGDFEAADVQLKLAMRYAPDSVAVHVGRGVLENAREAHARAISCFDRALECDPRAVRALCGMGWAVMGLASVSGKGSVADGGVWFERALAVDAGCADAAAGLALVREFAGDYEGAASLIRPLIERGERDVTLAVILARICHKLGCCGEALEYGKRVLALSTLSVLNRKSLLFALARVLDREGDYAAAFEYYRAANSLAARPGFDAVEQACNVEYIIRTFTPGLFMRVPQARNRDSRPVFIVGMPRSGTSLVEQILATHPDVYGAGECTALGDLVLGAGRQYGGHFPCFIERLDAAAVEQIANVYLNALSQRAGGERRITDKMPHNFYFLGLIQILFPNARVIHCRRDPLDTCLSIYFQDFSVGHSYANDLYQIGVHYHQYRRLVGHWSRVLSIPMLEVRYEDLVDDQERVTRELLEFCGLDWDSRCLAFHRSGRLVNTSSYGQVRESLYRHAVARWKHYEPWLGELKKGLERGF